MQLIEIAPPQHYHHNFRHLAQLAGFVQIEVGEIVTEERRREGK